MRMPELEPRVEAPQPDVGDVGGVGQGASRRLAVGTIAPIAALLVCLVSPTPAHADALGRLVNQIMDEIFYGKPQTSRPPPRDLRKFPRDARSGVLSPPHGRLAEVDGESLHISPGVLIFDRSNRIVAPARIRRPVKILYKLDHLGQLHRVWLEPPLGGDAPVTHVRPERGR